MVCNLFVYVVCFVCFVCCSLVVCYVISICFCLYFIFYSTVICLQCCSPKKIVVIRFPEPSNTYVSLSCKTHDRGGCKSHFLGSWNLYFTFRPELKTGSGQNHSSGAKNYYFVHFLPQSQPLNSLRSPFDTVFLIYFSSNLLSYHTASK